MVSYVYMYLEIIIGACIIAIALLLITIRTNSAVVFFSVCAGSVLATQLGSDASLLSSTVVKDGDLNKSIAYVALIVLPALLSAIFLRSSISSSKSVFNVVPSIAVGALLALLVIPQLPPGINEQLLDSSAWAKLQDYQPIILVGGMISSVFMLYVTHSHGSKHKKHKR